MLGFLSWVLTMWFFLIPKSISLAYLRHILGLYNGKILWNISKYTHSKMSLNWSNLLISGIKINYPVNRYNYTCITYTAQKNNKKGNHSHKTHCAIKNDEYSA